MGPTLMWPVSHLTSCLSADPSPHVPSAGQWPQGMSGNQAGAQPALSCSPPGCCCCLVNKQVKAFVGNSRGNQLYSDPRHCHSLVGKLASKDIRRETNNQLSADSRLLLLVGKQASKGVRWETRQPALC